MSEKRTWTNAQLKAIEAENRSILVSAAAGSGKTSVLIERYIKILESGVSPERILAITFTKKAATQLREKAIKALYQSKNSLLVQLIPRVSQASISTIHSFCAALIREYSAALSLDPSFSVLDESQSKELMEQAFENVAYIYSKDSDKETAYQSLLKLYCAGRGDEDFRGLVFGLFEFLRRLPKPEDKVKEWLNLYQELNCAASFQETTWGKLYLDMLNPEVRKLEAELNRFRSDFLADAFRQDLARCGKSTEISVRLSSEIEALKGMINAFPDLEFMARSISLLNELDRFPSIKAEFSNLKTTINRWKTWRDYIRNGFSNKWLAPTDRQLSDIRRAFECGELQLLLKLTNDFSKTYSKIKKTSKSLDFADLISEAYNLLAESKANNPLLYESLTSRYSYVMMDEYQDTNPIQDAIIEMLSASSKVTVFRVGDIKQSIYRFQHAEPDLFKSRYCLSSDCLESESRKIDLPDNFRSTKPIIKFVNAVFKRMMTAEFGGADYSIGHALQYKYGEIQTEPDYSPSFPGVMVKVILQSDNDENECVDAEVIMSEEPSISQASQSMDNETDLSEDSLQTSEMVDLERTEREAVLVARQILDLVNADPRIFVFEERKGEYVKVPITYKHITVLLSAMSSRIDAYARVFSQMGIPLQATGRDVLYDIPFACDFMNLLKIIDNPFQDIPLAGVLLSPIYGIGHDLLYLVRQQASHKVRLYEAVITALEKGFKGFSDAVFCANPNVSLPEQIEADFGSLKQFYFDLVELREFASSHSLSDLLNHTTARLSLDLLAAVNNESLNSSAFIDWIRAQVMDADDLHLSKFIKRVEKSARLEFPVGSTGDVVQMMTIHQAKGLEFPVVILSDLSHRFNLKDLQQNILFDRELGFGCKVKHERTPTRYPTASFRIIERSIKTKQLEEELRKLYVAMTRARERLILITTCTEKDIHNRYRYSMRSTGDLINGRENAYSFNDWNIPDLLESKAFSDSLTLDFSDSRFVKQDFESEFNPVIIMNSNIDEMLRSRMMDLKLNSNRKDEESVDKIKTEALIPTSLLSGLPTAVTYDYPFISSSRLRSKISATTLSQMDDPDGQYISSFNSFHTLALPDLESIRTKLPHNAGLSVEGFRNVSSISGTSNATKRGLVSHVLMQRLPYGQGVKIDAVNELHKAIESGAIIERDAPLVSIEAIESLLDSDIGVRLSGLGTAKTEWRFITRAEVQYIVKNARIMNSLGFTKAGSEGFMNLKHRSSFSDQPPSESFHPDDFLLIQGVVDLIFEDEKGRMIIDWKTDNITKEQIQERAEHYKLQMWAYNLAVTASFGDVHETHLGFIMPKEFVSIQFD